MIHTTRFRRLIGGALPFLALSVGTQTVFAQVMPALPEAPSDSAVKAMPAAIPQENPTQTATFLVREAFDVATRNPAARPVAVKTAAALLPRLLPASGGENGPQTRESLTNRWMQFVMASPITSAQRADALDAFFEVAARTDAAFAQKWALQTKDDAARAGALVKISRAVGPGSWEKADDLLTQATRAARQEPSLLPRARALVFVAYRAAELNPARRADAIREASSQVALLQAGPAKDNLLADLSGAASTFDLNLGRTIGNRIGDQGLKNLAAARANISEISQTTLTSRAKERVKALATAAAPYDARALPILLTLPPQPDVLRAISDALPRIYPTARPAIDSAQLEQIWNYSAKAPEGLYRDQLQSRAARLMVLKDLWRGRSWGQQLTWKGGRIQVGAFLKEVLDARRSTLQAAKLQDVAKVNVDNAYNQAQKLAPAAKTEALLLLAGQVLA